MVLFVRTDWLVRKWLGSALHLWAAAEAKSRVKSLICDQYSVYWQKSTNFSISVQYILQRHFAKMEVLNINLRLFE